MTTWFHARDGRQLGPVDENELKSLISTGVISADDLVWTEGMPEWLPLSDLPQFDTGRPLPPPPPPPAAAPLGDGPRFADPAGLAWTPGGDVDIADALSLGFTGFTRNFWVGCLGVVLYWVGSLAGGMVPILGFFSPMLVGWPLWGGVLHVGVIAADEARGRPRRAVADDLFAPFQINYAQAVLYSFLFWAASLLLIVAWLVSFLPAILAFPDSHSPFGGSFLVAVLATVPFCYFALRWVFVWRFMLDRRMGAIPAFRASWEATRGQVLQLALLALLLVPIYLIGLLLLGVGLIPAGFLGACIFGAAYRQVAGDTRDAVA